MASNLVKDWMTQKVLTVTPETSLTAADVTMEARQLRRLLVVSEDGLAGILSEGDLKVAKATYEAAGGAEEPTVGDIMTADPITISENYTVALAAQTMLSAKIGGLPVVDDAGKLIGVLSESDVFRYVIAMAR